jgi:hypothetical protein
MNSQWIDGSSRLFFSHLPKKMGKTTSPPTQIHRRFIALCNSIGGQAAKGEEECTLQ